jgi:hypothetical protein
VREKEIMTERKREITTDGANLFEKYLHSQGASLLREGRFDEALDHLRRALALDDQHYIRFDMGLAYAGSGNLDKAMEEIDRAIAMRPDAPEYYYQRSLFRKLRGDTSGSLSDLQRARAIDPAYNQIDQIRSAMAALEEFVREPDTLRLCDDVRPEDGELAAILRETRKNLRRIQLLFEKSTCPVPCPAYCCHFTGDLIRHGVHIGPWKLRAIRQYLRDRGLEESYFLQRTVFEHDSYMTNIIPPNYAIKEGGVDYIYFPRRGPASLGKRLSGDAPKDRDYRTVAWMTENARACRFLTHGRCMIHDLGDDSGLDACKQFLCFTGFVFVALCHLKILTPEKLSENPMGAFNRLAIDALLILDRRLCSNNRLSELRTSINRTLRDAVEADTRDDSGSLRDHLGDYQELRERHSALLREELQKIRISLAASLT